VFNPYMGELPPNSEIPVTVTIYNNVCGKFDDRIISKVKGLADVEFPMSISISGSPIRIPLKHKVVFESHVSIPLHASSSLHARTDVPGHVLPHWSVISSPASPQMNDPSSGHWAISRARPKVAHTPPHAS
jgi:hypothetical protein